ncbi:hypothetical protein GCM10009642_18810 [Nocardiopsis metallicus]
MPLPSPDTPPMTPLESSDPRRIPPFDIRGRLGAGGMGVVYAAMSPENQWVAVKVIRPEFADDEDFRQRFTREVQLMSRIRARCISSVLAYETAAEQPWFATAFLPGPTLGQRVRRQGALPEAKARVLAVGMAEAIAAIHASGVVHRDLKPSNVILAPDGPKVLDFGIARALDGTQLTRTGGLMGSPGWMSPERFSGGAGPEADVFSWGALVAYAVTGRPPFGTGSAEELMFRLLSGEPDLSGVPESLREVVTRALAKDPADRPTAAELVRALAAGGGEGPVPDSPHEMATMVGALIDQDWSGTSPSVAPGASVSQAAPATPAPGAPGTGSVPGAPMTGPNPGPPATGSSPDRSHASVPHGPHTPPGPHRPTGPRAPSGPHTPARQHTPQGVQAPPAPSPGAPRAKGSRLLVGLAAAASALLMIGGVTGWLLLREGPDPTGDTSSGEQAAGDGGPGLPAEAAEDQSDPFVFATAEKISSPDPFLASDESTFRFSRQVFETLLRHDPADGQIVGGLAESWEHSDDGTEWTFHLREGVRFHDGDELDAATVCANFDRWYNIDGVYQQTKYTRHWQSVFGGFAEQTGYNEAESNYRSCRVVDGLTAAITVNEYTPALPGGFTYASFGIMSASAVAEFADEPLIGPLGDYSSNPGALAGTGPFRISEWDRWEAVVALERFDEHRDGSAGVDTVIMRGIPNDAARRQALESGEIHGYERALPEDVAQLERAGFQMPSREPHRLFYLGFQPEAHEALEVAEVREALARAVDRQSIVNTVMSGDGEVPAQLVPEAVNGGSPNARTIEHSPEAAEGLLASTGHGDLTLDLCYPNDLSQVFLPDPEATQNLITQDLEAIGVTVEPVAQSWNDLSDSVRAGDCALYLHTAWGNQNDTLNFLNSYLFTLDQFSEAGADDLAEAFDEARSLPGQEQRRAAYEELNEQLMEFLPVLPIAAFSDATVYSKEIEPPQAGPLPGHENFAEIFWK